MRRFVTAVALMLPLSLTAQSLPPVAAVARVADSLAVLYLGQNTFGVGFDRELRFIFTTDGTRATKVALLQRGERTEGLRK